MRAAASDRLPVIQLESRELEHLERLLQPAAVVQTTRKTVLRRTGVGQKESFTIARKVVQLLPEIIVRLYSHNGEVRAKT